jgi:hypothetical protein
MAKKGGKDAGVRCFPRLFTLGRDLIQQIVLSTGEPKQAAVTLGFVVASRLFQVTDGNPA